MKEFFEDLGRSGWKKLTVLLLGTWVVLLRDQFDIDEGQVDQIVWICAAYLAGQGIADLGKSKALIERETKRTPP